MNHIKGMLETIVSGESTTVCHVLIERSQAEACGGCRLLTGYLLLVSATRRVCVTGGNTQSDTHSLKENEMSEQCFFPEWLTSNPENMSMCH